MEKKYQRSKFIGENREEQIVVRSDNFEEFKEAWMNIESLFSKKESVTEEKPKAPNKEGTPVSIEEFEKTCNLCGGPKVLNPNTGKYFCKAKCWLDSK